MSKNNAVRIRKEIINQFTKLPLPDSGEVTTAEIISETITAATGKITNKMWTADFLKFFLFVEILSGTYFFMVFSLY